MNNLISPKYKMALIDDTYNKIWELYGSYKKVEFYIEKWISYVSVDWSFEKQPTFEIEKDSKNNIDLLSTLNKIDTETLLKIAIDL